MLRLAPLPALLLSSAAFAQDIVVTGRGLAEPESERVYSVTTLDRERLTGSASGRLDEILKEVPGFQLFRRSDARSANPTSQGSTLRALGGNASSRALLILDGVPQSDPFGGWINWPAYDPQRLARVRVVRGGGSGVNGPGALAGTTELFSAGPGELDGPYAGAFYGSRDSIDAYAGLGTVLGTGYLGLSANYGRGDGFIPVIEEQRGPVDRPSAYEHASASLRAVTPVGDHAELQANGLIFHDERERGVPFTDNRTTGADASLRLVGGRWSALGYVQTRDYYNSFASVGDDRGSADQVAEQFSVPSSGYGTRFEVRPDLGAVEFRLGGDWRRTVGKTQERFAFQNGAGTRRRIAGGRTDTLGGFAEAAWQRGALTLTGGGRIDRWWIGDGSLEERVIATASVLTDTDFADRSGWEPTARAGIAWKPAGAVTLRSAAYLGWRLPTLNELYRPFRVGDDTTRANAALDPERLRGIEAGIEYQPLATARVGVTLFTNRLSDGIANVTIGAGGGGVIRQRQNLDAIASRGVEVDGRFDFGAWSLAGGYSYADAEVEADGGALSLDGRRPAQTPRHSLAGTLAWRGLSGARVSATMRYVGAQFEDDLNQQRLPDALTFDAATDIPLTGRLSLAARAENILDERVVTGISGDGIIERATPRTLWIGLRLRAD